MRLEIVYARHKAVPSRFYPLGTEVASPDCLQHEIACQWTELAVRLRE
jgi:hypothetical protein